jgi:iron-sulfur cluster assembly protein
MSSAISLTPQAQSHVKRLIERESKVGEALRISVVGGGCSGLSYKMSFEKAPAEGDQVIVCDGFQVVVDPRSALFLKGIVVDYEDGLNGAGFTYNNPNAKRSCGCGTSFSA